MTRDRCQARGDPGRWHSGIPTYAKVRYAEVYPGTDLVYYGNQGRLEYDFVVRPGADPARAPKISPRISSALKTWRKSR